MQCKYVFGDRLEKDNIKLFCMQYVPSLCKIIEYGKTVRMIGPKDHLLMTAWPEEKSHEIATMIGYLYGIPAIVTANFLSLTLTPSNQIIHPGRVFGVFRDWDGKTPIHKSKIPLVYEEMDDVSAKHIQDLDDEI
jgi:hypothetical protein